MHLIIHKVEYTLYVSSHVRHDEIVFTYEILRIIVHQRIGTYNTEQIGLIDVVGGLRLDQAQMEGEDAACVHAMRMIKFVC